MEIIYAYLKISLMIKLLVADRNSDKERQDE